MKLLHNGAPSFKCDECNERAYLPGTIRVHKRKVHGTGGSSLYQPDLLDITSNASSNQNDCETRTVSEAESASVNSTISAISNRHEKKKIPTRITSSEVPLYAAEKFKCQQCHVIFLEFKYLSEHVKKVHSGKEKFPCEVCQKCLLGSSSFRRHIKDVHSNADFVCTECEKKFRSKRLLKSHMDTRSESEKLYAGGGSFKHSSYLRKHERLHQSPRYCQCDVTGCGSTLILTI